MKGDAVQVGDSTASCFNPRLLILVFGIATSCLHCNSQPKTLVCLVIIGGTGGIGLSLGRWMTRWPVKQVPSM